MKGTPIALFLGSGASRSSPSNLPTFSEMRTEWVGVISRAITHLVDVHRQEGLKKRIRETPPEALLQVIDQVSSGRLMETLKRILDDSAVPNIVHEVAAKLISNGGTVWTTNFDLLVERAAGLLPNDSVIAYNQAASASFLDPRVRLLKPHGTLFVPNTLMFRSRDVLRPTNDAVRERLVSDLCTHLFVFIGYSASDLDLRPILRDHLNDSKGIIWFCFDGEDDGLRERLSLGRKNTAVEFRTSSSPIKVFLQWAYEQKLVIAPGSISQEAIDLSSLGDLLNEPLILARLFQRLRAFDISRRVLQKVIKKKPRAVFTWINMLRYERHPMGILAAVIWRGLQSLSPKKSTREHALYSLSYLAFEGGYYRLGAYVAKVGLSTPSFERRIQHSACLRMLGKFDKALQELALIEWQSELLADANQEVRLLFEKAMSLRWSGREQEAIELIVAADASRVTHADPTWRGWLAFELGTCLSLRYPEVELDRAYQQARSAENIFVPILSTQPAGLLNTHLLYSSLNRLSGDWDSAIQQLETFRERIRGLAGEAFLNGAATFEEGELARYNGQSKVARQRYETLLQSKSPLHRAHGRLGLAEMNRDMGLLRDGAQEAWKALGDYQRIGCRWGECQSLLTLVLCGDLSWNTAEARARDTGYAIPCGNLRALYVSARDDVRVLNLP